MIRRPAVVLDTMVLAQAAVNPRSPSGALVWAGIEGSFRPVTSYHQLLELDRTLHKPGLVSRFRATSINDFPEAYGDLARVVRDFPSPMLSPMTLVTTS